MSTITIIPDLASGRARGRRRSREKMIMKRYSIMARHEGRNNEIELCQCDSNPEAIAEAGRLKTVKRDLGIGKRPISIPMYEHVRIRRND
jgi:hypothetical protein